MQKDGKWGYVDENNAFMIDAKFDETKDFSESLAPVRMGAKWGYADRFGLTVIEPTVVDTYVYREGMA